MRDRAINIRHMKSSRGYCFIYLGNEYQRPCREHSTYKSDIIDGKRHMTKANAKIIESFRKISDIRGTWLSSK